MGWKTEKLSELRAVVWQFPSIKNQLEEQIHCFSIQNLSTTKNLSIENSMNAIDLDLVAMEKQRMYLLVNQN